MATENSTSEVQEFNPEELMRCIQKALGIAKFVSESDADEYAPLACDEIVDNLLCARRLVRMLLERSATA